MPRTKTVLPILVILLAAVAGVATAGERYDVARNYPEVVAEIEGIMEEAHVAHPNWKPPSGR